MLSLRVVGRRNASKQAKHFSSKPAAKAAAAAPQAPAQPPQGGGGFGLLIVAPLLTVGASVEYMRRDPAFRASVEQKFPDQYGQFKAAVAESIDLDGPALWPFASDSVTTAEPTNTDEPATTTEAATTEAATAETATEATDPSAAVAGDDSATAAAADAAAAAATAAPAADGSGDAATPAAEEGAVTDEPVATAVPTVGDEPSIAAAPGAVGDDEAGAAEEAVAVEQSGDSGDVEPAAIVEQQTPEPDFDEVAMSNGVRSEIDAINQSGEQMWKKIAVRYALSVLSLSSGSCLLTNVPELYCRAAAWMNLRPNRTDCVKIWKTGLWAI
jgi:hypothetical protein